MELAIENTEVVSANNIQIEAPGSIEVIEGEKDYEVSVVKKEYTIIGDSIFIPSMYEDAPPWLKEFINTTLEVAITNRDQSLVDRMEAILTLMDYVPKNQYIEQINQIVSEDGIINSRIATLNSNLTGAINSTNATIAEINFTYASKNEAAAIATNVITASLSGSGEIGSALIELQEAYANLDSITAQSISMLDSVMEGEINANSQAMQTIRTYVGIDEAGAGTDTGLSAYLEASDGTIGGADSQLANDIRVTAEGVESKFAYNSIVNINGIYKKSGFGLTTNYTSGSGTEVDPYVSELWIDVSRFKFTNSNQTGQVAPFTIDATGATPKITFNGIVSFSNVADTNNVLTTGQSAADINNGLTTLNGGKITIGSITADQIAINSITAEKIVADSITVDRIKANDLAVTQTYLITGFITQLTAGTPDLTIDNTNLIGEFTIVNPSSVRSISLLVSGAGRTGIVGSPSSTLLGCFGCWVNGIKVFDYGWSSMQQDSKSATFNVSINAGQSAVVQVRGCKQEGLEYAFIMQFSTLGIIN